MLDIYNLVVTELHFDPDSPLIDTKDTRSPQQRKRDLQRAAKLTAQVWSDIDKKPEED